MPLISSQPPPPPSLSYHDPIRVRDHGRFTPPGAVRGAACCMATAAAESAEIYRLPEECVAYAISLTTPGDACHSSAVSPAFRAAADSDAVWERFLPPDHADVLARADDDDEPAVAGASSKKELFSRLCDSPVLLDGATMSFGLDRRSGAKCFMLSARALSIAWGDDPSCWTWTASPPGSRFPEVAELVDVCWLEISGKLSLSLLSPGTTYAAYLVFTMADDSYGLECHVGMPPPKATVTVSSSGTATTTTSTSKTPAPTPTPSTEHAICLHHMQGSEEAAAHRRKQQYVRLRRGYGIGNGGARKMLTTTREADPDIRCPRRRGDGWAEVEMGEFAVAGDEGGAATVEVRVQEVDGRRWKRGLVVLGVEIRPKHHTAAAACS